MKHYATETSINDAVAGGGLLIVAQWEAKPGEADKVAAILDRFLPEAQREAGVKLFLISRARDNPAQFLFYELFRDEAAFKARAAQLEQRFAQLETRVVGPWFDGEKFSLVDAVFGPVFRYFDVFDEIGDFGILNGKPKVARWRQMLAARPSVRTAVSADYPALLRDFIERRRSYLSQLQAKVAA